MRRYQGIRALQTHSMNWYKVECNITVTYVSGTSTGGARHACYDDGDDVCMTPGPIESREIERSGLSVLCGVEA